jgi:hypothetical protein
MKANVPFVRLGSLKSCTKGSSGNDYDCCFRGTYYEAQGKTKGDKKTLLQAPRHTKRQ